MNIEDIIYEILSAECLLKVTPVSFDAQLHHFGSLVSLALATQLLIGKFI